MIYCDAPEPGIKGHQGHPGVKGQQGTPGAKGDPGETAAGNFISYLFLWFQPNNECSQCKFQTDIIMHQTNYGSNFMRYIVACQ